MAINFPDSPSIGDEFTGGGFTWTWNGSSWEKVASSSNSNPVSFYLAVTDPTAHVYTLSDPQPAGEYLFFSESSDTTLEVRLIAADGSSAGESTSKSIVATKEFVKVGLFAATQNDIISFVKSDFITSESIGTDVFPTLPAVMISATPTILPFIDDTTVVTGQNFTTGIQVSFVGQDNVQRSAKNVVRSSSTEMVVTRPDDFPAEQEPYSLLGENPGVTSFVGGPNVLESYFDAGASILWSTSAGALSTTYTAGFPYSFTIAATDPDLGGAVTYTLQSGQLPTGISLNQSTGEISGTSSDTANQTFVVRATDNGGNFADREFVLKATPSLSGGSKSTDASYVYHTFTSSGDLEVIGDDLEVEIMTLAGGGGSWTGGSWSGGEGGGAGGLVDTQTLTLSVGATYPVVVGAGGAAGTNTTPGKGTESTFGTTLIVAEGGGAAKSAGTPALANGGSGGSPSGIGIIGQGNDGATGTTGAYGGGGGGKVSAGQAIANSGGPGGAGTTEYSDWASATSTGLSGEYARGGYGSPYNGGPSFTGPANSGFGGSGGAGHNGYAAAPGSSGVVIVRYAA